MKSTLKPFSSKNFLRSIPASKVRRVSTCSDQAGVDADHSTFFVVVGYVLEPTGLAFLHLAHRPAFGELFGDLHVVARVRPH